MPQKRHTKGTAGGKGGKFAPAGRARDVQADDSLSLDSQTNEASLQEPADTGVGASSGQPISRESMAARLAHFDVEARHAIPSRDAETTRRKIKGSLHRLKGLEDGQTSPPPGPLGTNKVTRLRKEAVVQGVSVIHDYLDLADQGHHVEAINGLQSFRAAHHSTYEDITSYAPEDTLSGIETRMKGALIHALNGVEDISALTPTDWKPSGEPS